MARSYSAFRPRGNSRRTPSFRPETLSLPAPQAGSEAQSGFPQTSRLIPATRDTRVFVGTRLLAGSKTTMHKIDNSPGQPTYQNVLVQRQDAASQFIGARRPARNGPRCPAPSPSGWRNCAATCAAGRSAIPSISKPSASAAAGVNWETAIARPTRRWLSRREKPPGRSPRARKPAPTAGPCSPDNSMTRFRFQRGRTSWPKVSEGGQRGEEARRTRTRPRRPSRPIRVRKEGGPTATPFAKKA